MVSTTSSVISSLQSSSASDSTKTKNSSSDLASQEVFLELLIVQMQNQDPLDPMDNQQFLSQIAQLSTVEQLRTMNSNLETMQLYEMSINNTNAVSMIGKTVKAIGDTVTLDSSRETNISYWLQGDASKIHITIYDADQVPVRSIDLSDQEEGKQTYVWDGNNNDGSPVDEGEYSFTVTAEDSSGNAIEVDTYISGVVRGVSFEDGYPVLQVGNQKVTMGDIFEVIQE